jgi:N2-acetyl-L-2,4-diaminobutanoate deacetylase
MAAQKTRITTDVDFDRDGVQLGMLRVPHSRNSSAWGMILVPIVVLKNGDGPTTLLTAGAHGDEFEGPIALSKLTRALEPSEMRGRLIILPAMNVPGIHACQRICPVDGRDLNRTFPGKPGGSFTQMLAHYVSYVLVPMADAVVDFHSGGYSLDFAPCVIMHHLDDPARHGQTMAAMQAFGAPLGIVIRELDDSGQLDTFVEGEGKLFLSTELAGGSSVSVKALRMAEQGIWNLLAHFGHVAPDHPRVAGGQTERLVEVPHHDAYVIAPEEGVYEPFVDLGDSVREGQEVGQLHILANPARAPVVLTAGQQGVLIAKRSPGKTEAGDCLAVVAHEYTP